MFAICDKILFLKCNWWKSKTKVEIKVKGEYIRKHNFCFRIFDFPFFITYMDDLKINGNNVIDWHFASRSFFRDLNFHFFLFKGSKVESWKVILSSSILQQKWKTIIGSDFIVKSKRMKSDLAYRNMFKSNIFAVFSFLFIVTYFFTIL